MSGRHSYLRLCPLLVPLITGGWILSSTPVGASPTYDLNVVELDVREVCNDCTGHGLGEVDGELIVYATLNSDEGNLLAYAEDGSVVEMAPNFDLSAFLDSDGPFVSFSIMGIENGSTAVDYERPGNLINPQDTTTGVSIEPFGVNSSGDLAGGLDGLVAGTYTAFAGTSRFLPGPQSSLGIGWDINEAASIVGGQSAENDNSSLDIATLWEVDENLQVTNSFFLGSGEGEATFVGDTIFDPEATVIFTDANLDEPNAVYLKSTGEILPFGSVSETISFSQDIEILTATPNALLILNLETNACSLVALGLLGAVRVSVGANCVDATTIGDDTYVLYGDGTVTRYSVETTLAPSNASFATALLPSSRSVEVGDTATGFFTAINTSTNFAIRCQLIPRTAGLDVSFFYQATDPETNGPIGDVDTPIDIVPGAAQSFVFGVTPGETIAPREIGLSLSCLNAVVPVPIEGLSTVLLSASDTPVADVIALAATVMNDGIVRVDPASGGGAFSVASVNVGDAGSLMVSADTGSADLPVDLAMCQTNPTTGACMNPAAPTFDPVSVTIGVNETPTFAVFASSSEDIALDPANSRVFVRFSDDAGESRGATSVAVTTAE